MAQTSEPIIAITEAGARISRKNTRYMSIFAFSTIHLKQINQINQKMILNNQKMMGYPNNS